MARPREFDRDKALTAAIDVFRTHGFAGTSTVLLTGAMGIGRQSLYDTFGDKWQLYCAAVQHYATTETRAHLEALQTGPTAREGLRRMLARVIAEARHACLGVGSICEFGTDRQELVELHAAAGQMLRKAISDCIRAAQADDEVAAEIDAAAAAGFLIATIAGMRVAARGGASEADLQALAGLALRALQ